MPVDAHVFLVEQELSDLVDRGVNVAHADVGRCQHVVKREPVTTLRRVDAHPRFQGGFRVPSVRFVVR